MGRKEDFARGAIAGVGLTATAIAARELHRYGFRRAMAHPGKLEEAGVLAVRGVGNVINIPWSVKEGISDFRKRKERERVWEERIRTREREKAQCRTLLKEAGFDEEIPLIDARLGVRTIESGQSTVPIPIFIFSLPSHAQPFQIDLGYGRVNFLRAPVGAGSNISFEFNEHTIGQDRREMLQGNFQGAVGSVHSAKVNLTPEDYSRLFSPPVVPLAAAQTA